MKKIFFAIALALGAVSVQAQQDSIFVTYSLDGVSVIEVREEISSGMKISSSLEDGTRWYKGSELFLQMPYGNVEFSFSDVSDSWDMYAIGEIVGSDNDTLRIHMNEIMYLNPSGDGTTEWSLHNFSTILQLGVDTFFVLGRNEPAPHTTPSGIREFSDNAKVACNGETLKISSSDVLKDVKIMDISGRLVLATQPNDFSTEINISPLPSGIYIAAINNGRGYKFIKQ